MARSRARTRQLAPGTGGVGDALATSDRKKAFSSEIKQHEGSQSNATSGSASNVRLDVDGGGTIIRMQEPHTEAGTKVHAEESDKSDGKEVVKESSFDRPAELDDKSASESEVEEECHKRSPSPRRAADLDRIQAEIDTLKRFADTSGMSQVGK
ncbi:unnamed protein product [Protopolystoma xenopodis]|uniref:Uncharacterized protein n=1 Tax=Protopolystoma xenopodis TaxID=117903 RepID=A0A3S5CID8_9PLAT|nr:unnamed protein product [Protopolystoma xenopodis]